ncbi:hypothetical protein [Xanthomonas vasicola]|uniref:hypothetical protein n=1 Tax=Xanthomonas vasicola TaxID=56459 RepID=UPI0011C3835A|nr:hypothetical protein [Xanthomonas vasicola]
MKSFLLVFFLVLASPGATQLQAADVEDSAVSAAAKQIVDAERISLQMAPIKTRHALDLYIESVPQEISAFKDILPMLRDEFINSLKFNEKGLTEFDTSSFKKLSPTQVYSVLALFGLEEGAYKINAAPRTRLDKDVNAEPLMQNGDFLEGYRCEERATCGESQRSACTSNC